MLQPELKFEEFRKIARLNRDIVITEKIDGTNSQVFIYESDEAVDPLSIKTWADEKDGCLTTLPGMFRHIRVGSRNRWLTVKEDNFGFARWATEHADDLRLLGYGRHYGEWWGSGIQRGYGLPKGEKRFSLFNTHKWNGLNVPSIVSVVPVLYQGPFSTEAINTQLERLRTLGSVVVPFLNPEGIVIYHTHANIYFKVTLKDDEVPKSTVRNLGDSAAW